jgi:hypothetical protein
VLEKLINTTRRKKRREKERKWGIWSEREEVMEGERENNLQGGMHTERVRE